MRTKLAELLYDIFLFAVVMLVVLLCFLFAVDWAMSSVKGAPAPFSKKEKPKPLPHYEIHYLGTWRCKLWCDWRLNFMDNKKYSATLNQSVWEGTWEVKEVNGSLCILIEEYPINNPNFVMKYCYPVTNFEKLIVTDF